MKDILSGISEEPFYRWVLTHILENERSNNMATAEIERLRKRVTRLERGMHILQLFECLTCEGWVSHSINHTPVNKRISGMCKCRPEMEGKGG